MDNEILDLDKSKPRVKKVRFNGKLYDIYPARLNDFIDIQRVYTTFQNNPESIDLLELRTVLKSVLPDIEELNLSFSQLTDVLSFSYNQEVANQEQSSEKKTPV